jgi:hypothetical protein
MAAAVDMEAVIGLKDLEDSRKTTDVPRDRTLLPDLTGRDPDDAYSTVPYEQGALFLSFSSRSSAVRSSTPSCGSG